MERCDEVSVIWDPQRRKYQTDFIDVPRLEILGAPRNSVGRFHVLAESRSSGATCLLPCSAVLISERHIMTNRHCAAPHLYPDMGIRSAPEDFGVMFGHLSDTDPGEFFRLQREPVEISEGAFPENYEPLSFANPMTDAGDPMFIVSHPSGFRMQVTTIVTVFPLIRVLSSEDSPSDEGEDANLLDANLSGTDFTELAIIGANFSDDWAWHDKKTIEIYEVIMFCVFDPEIH